jgi:hypothetical protein
MLQPKNTPGKLRMLDVKTRRSVEGRSFAQGLAFGYHIWQMYDAYEDAGHGTK